MTEQKKALKLKGDLVDNFHVGQALGPGLDGFYRRVTAVTFDKVRKVTLVELDVPETVAPEGRRLRFHGDAADTGAEPAPSIAGDDPIETR